LPKFITAGPDGNLWFGEVYGDRIGRITPAGVFSEFPLPKPGSKLWATDRGTDSIAVYRIP
jgi:virginiamycin B lyase